MGIKNSKKLFVCSMFKIVIVINQKVLYLNPSNLSQINGDKDKMGKQNFNIIINHPNIWSVGFQYYYTYKNMVYSQYIYNIINQKLPSMIITSNVRLFSYLSLHLFFKYKIIYTFINQKLLLINLT